VSLESEDTLGEEVEVIHDPLRPEGAKLLPGSTLRFGPSAFMVEGVLVLGAALLFFLFFLMMVLLVFV